MKKSMVRRVGRVFLLSLSVGTLTAATACAVGDDPLAIVNNLSDFIFSIIKAVGIIILGWGRCAGGHEHTEPRRQPADPGPAVPVRRAAHCLCQGNSDADRRGVSHGQQLDH